MSNIYRKDKPAHEDIDSLGHPLTEGPMDDILPQGLLAILDEDHAQGLSTHEILEHFLDAEAVPFILRNKSKSQPEFEDYAKEVNLLRLNMDFDFIVHGSVKLALETDAIGVHLTSKTLSVAEARQHLGEGHIVGYSAHSLEEALTAARDGADYIFLGAIFETPKPDANHPILGIDVLKEACKKIDVPVYAIGGISSENLLSIKDAGAAGFSALRAIYQDQEVEHNVSKLGFMWDDI